LRTSHSPRRAHRTGEPEAGVQGSDATRPADSSGMPPGVRFVDVLDDALSATAWDAPTPDEPMYRTASPPPISYTPLYNLHTVTRGAGFEVQALNGAEVVAAAYTADIASTPFASTGGEVESGQARIWSNPRRRDVGERSRPRVIPEVHAAASRSARPECKNVRTPVPSPAPQRRTRRLTTTQSRSLEAFNQLGAGVRADFSAGELRSAFRMLARTYHPDRHPSAGASDRQRLAQQFSTIRASYETLLTVLDTPGA